MGIFPRIKKGTRKKNAKDDSLAHKESLLQEKKCHVSPSFLAEENKNKTIILYFSACSICLYRVIPCAQRHFIRQETFQKRARKSNETKGVTVG